MNKIQNDISKENVGMNSIKNRMRESRLKRFGHVCVRPMDALVRAFDNYRRNKGGKMMG